ncbi:phosphate ABC transporter ATP-binding protein [Calothrix sp. FACHB-156]|nr:phosphate ABC transporter ATP-binding protein [Nostoc linckia FACHB-104]MBD2341385.1 phosphate ABC transporter ATP-binding protein [Calothrix sp. FACHB-156]
MLNNFTATNTTTIIDTETVLRTENLNVYYGKFLALQNICLNISKNQVTAFIGPSGCGKSTLLRCYNRLNDLVKSFRAEGQVYFYDKNLYAPEIDAVEVRRRIGMVFQTANPFPKSIYDNVAFGARVNGYKDNMDELVEQSLRQSALWDEVKDRLRQSALALSGGQQQRLCIARAIAGQPEVILMDEPCSALDPLSTLRVEELIHELKKQYTIVIVTHNMQQAARVSDKTAFFNVSSTQTRDLTGYLVEYDSTNVIFNHPQQEATKDYISGRFG